MGRTSLTIFLGVYPQGGGGGGNLLNLGYFEFLRFFVMTQNSLRNVAKFYAQLHSVYFSVTRLTEEGVMNHKEIIQAIHIGCFVGHALKAIELCKESLVLRSNKALSKEKQLGQLFYKNIYYIMFEAYHRVSDHTNAIAYGRQLLAIVHECGDTFKAGRLSIKLAQIHIIRVKVHVYMLRQNNFLREQSLPIKRASGHRREEAVAYGGLGNVFYSFGEYVKAKEYYQKALAISMEIGDRKNENACYRNLGDVFQYLGEYVTAKEHQ